MSRLTNFQQNVVILAALLTILIADRVYAFSDDLEIGVNANFMLNLKANFKNLRGFVVAPGPGPNPDTDPGRRVDRFYDDGFVRVGQNDRGLTSFWGYDNASQVVGDTLVFNSTRIVPNNSTQLSSLSSDANDLADFSQNGAEIFVKFPRGDARFGGPIWGIRESFSYFKINIEDSRTLRLSADQEEIIDAFPLNGVIPPTAPFTGSDAGPGPLIGDTPMRLTENITPAGDLASFQDRELEADMISFGLGPYWDFYPHDRLGFSIDGGILLTWVFSDFRINETVMTNGIPSKNQDSDDQSEFLIGGFIEAKVSFELNLNLAIQGGARYQLMEDFEHEQNGEIAELDFSEAAILTVGFSYLY